MTFSSLSMLDMLNKLPTLNQGHTDDLKLETATTRVWLSRLTIEDGKPYNNQVTVETYNSKTGAWVTTEQYEAR